MVADADRLVLASIDQAGLRTLNQQAVEETLRRLEEARSSAPDRRDRLAYPEAEAAALLGLAQHVLRDERRRGRIAATKVVGGRVRYTRQDLIDYLMASRREASLGRDL